MDKDNQKKQFLETLSLIEHIAWTGIGIIILVALLAAIVMGPKRFSSEVLGIDNSFSTATESKSESPKSTSRYTPAQIKCANDIFGQARVQELLQDPQKATKEERQQIKSCLSE